MNIIFKKNVLWYLLKASDENRPINPRIVCSLGNKIEMGHTSSNIRYIIAIQSWSGKNENINFLILLSLVLFFPKGSFDFDFFPFGTSFSVLVFRKSQCINGENSFGICFRINVIGFQKAIFSSLSISTPLKKVLRRYLPYAATGKCTFISKP